jgi:CelD/BcsL family acetyltransferase involved in cellulose biosynthesis
VAPSIRARRFEDVEAEWEAMLPRCATDTVFVTPWWQKAWWRCFGAEYDLRLLSVADGDAVLGLAPMVLREGVLSFLGDTDLFDYHDFVVPRGNEQPFYEAVLDYLAQSQATALDLKSVPQDSPTVELLPAIAERNGYSVQVDKEDVAPVADLPETWDEYVAGLGKKSRHELRRKLRRLEAAGDYRQYLCDAGRELSRCLDDFFRLHRASDPEKAAFWNPGGRQGSAATGGPGARRGAAGHVHQHRLWGLLFAV